MGISSRCVHLPSPFPPPIPLPWRESIIVDRQRGCARYESDEYSFTFFPLRTRVRSGTTLIDHLYHRFHRLQFHFWPSKYGNGCAISLVMRNFLPFYRCWGIFDMGLMKILQMKCMYDEIFFKKRVYKEITFVCM